MATQLATRTGKVLSKLGQAVLLALSGYEFAQHNSDAQESIVPIYITEKPKVMIDEKQADLGLISFVIIIIIFFVGLIVFMLKYYIKKVTSKIPIDLHLQERPRNDDV